MCFNGLHYVLCHKFLLLILTTLIDPSLSRSYMRKLNMSLSFFVFFKFFQLFLLTGRKKERTLTKSWMKGYIDRWLPERAPWIPACRLRCQRRMRGWSDPQEGWWPAQGFSASPVEYFGQNGFCWMYLTLQVSVISNIQLSEPSNFKRLRIVIKVAV